jgi:hypothetical protein
VDFIDADTLVFDAAEFDVFGLYTVNLEGSAPRSLASGIGQERWPTGGLTPPSG